MVGEDRVIMCEESGRESFVWEEIRLTFVDPHPQQPACALVSPAPKESVPPTIFMCIVVLRCFNTLAKYEMNKEIRFR